jgi:hypothetical protein
MKTGLKKALVSIAVAVTGWVVFGYLSDALCRYLSLNFLNFMWEHGNMIMFLCGWSSFAIMHTIGMSILRRIKDNKN